MRAGRHGWTTPGVRSECPVPLELDCARECCSASLRLERVCARECCSESPPPLELDCAQPCRETPSAPGLDRAPGIAGRPSWTAPVFRTPSHLAGASGVTRGGGDTSAIRTAP